MSGTDANRLPSGWAEAKVADVLPFCYGKGLPERSRDPHGTVPVFGSSGKVGHHSEPLVGHPTIIVGRKGSVGSVHLCDTPSYPIDTVFFSDRCDHLRIDFVAHQLRFLRLGQLDKSTTIPSLSRDHLHEVSVRLPPYNEQTRIVDAIEEQFTRLDSGVAALKRVEANLKRYKASVLKAACEGKLTEQWRRENPDVEPASELLKRILKERRRRWEEAELAKMLAKGKPPKNDKWKEKYKEPQEPDTEGLPTIPRSWVWATAEQLSDETRAITYGVVKLGGPVADGVPTLRSSNVRHLKLDEAGIKRISPDLSQQYRRTVLQGGEVVITVRGTLGGVVVVPASCKGYNISREVAMIALIDEMTGPTLATLIASPPIQTWLTRHCRGIAYTGINIETLKRMPVPLPPSAEQEPLLNEIEARLSEADATALTCVESNVRSTRLRQSILKRAFDGKLVDQDPDDEPASVLLERVRAGRDQDVKTKKRRARGVAGARKAKRKAEDGDRQQELFT